MIKAWDHWCRFGATALACILIIACSPNLEEIRPNNRDQRNFHPYPQTFPGRSLQWSSLDGKTTYSKVAPSFYKQSNPFDDPPGNNLIDTVESNMFDERGREMPNTLPSTTTTPYNLHDGPVETMKISSRSPTTDLTDIIGRARIAAKKGSIDRTALQEAIDIIEGNSVFPDRTYNGMPLLHYNGPDKVKKVEPIRDASGKIVGGNVNIHQIWYDSHIESDTAYVDTSAVFDVPWTVTYTVDVLEGGSDDFSPFVIYVDDPYASTPGASPKAHVGMDASFFPMNTGTRYIYRIKMSKGKYFNLTYHWGWRIHPPRIQVLENARKTVNGRTLPGYQRRVFGKNPTANREAQLAAIGKIGELAPAKRMWSAFLAALASNKPDDVLEALSAADEAFDDWKNRNALPAGVAADPDADITLFYVNNTLYGERKGGGNIRFDDWETRPYQMVVSLLNGDHFKHGYVSVDFGGGRGWENQFQSSVTQAGNGPYFTFGRAHWWVNAGGPWGLIDIPPIKDGVPGKHKVIIDLNFEPNRRLRMYQFDPYFHDVAIFSIH